MSDKSSMALDPPELRASLDEDQVLACPSCDSPNVKARTRDAPERWLCAQCMESFETPDVRERKTNTGDSGVHGLAKQLLDADPDEVSP